MTLGASTSALQRQTDIPNHRLPHQTRYPSTVPDSQFLLNVDCQPHYIPHVPETDRTTATGEKMTSQASDGPTQELSQSYIPGVIARSRIEQQLQEQGQGQGPHDYLDRESDGEGEHETERTQHQGDTGYLDLLSSLPAPHLGDDGEVEQQRPADEVEQEQEQEQEDEQAQEDSEPIEVDFSPTQSQNALSQFPESQRFKTPATAGRKRRYDGETVESPELPRNPAPLLRGGDSNAFAMGLSQMFAATQANTSPFVGKSNGVLHSDLPSPGIHLQPRPITAVSSSPMRLLPSAKRSTRAGTEPLDQYVSSKESQARREEKERQQLVEMARNLESDEDDLVIEEDSWALKERKRRERERHTRALLSSSSPPVPSSRSRPFGSRSSPILSLERNSPRSPRAAKRPTFTPASSPPRPVQLSQVTESEEETEQEDNDHVIVIVTSSSQSEIPPNEEDKENLSDHAVQVPDTTGFRLQRIVNELPSQEQESPLVRHGRRLNHDSPARAMNSSQHFAVADSQSERAVKRPRTVTQVPGSSAIGEALDFVPQSPESSPRTTAPVNPKSTSASATVPETRHVAQEAAETAVNSADPASISKTCQPLASTIPETSSNELQAQSDKSSHEKQNNESESRSDFDTAQTHPQPSSIAPQLSAGDDPTKSSPQISTTPPGRRRKRISDIQAEPSPLKSQPSFDASAALHVEANFLGLATGSLTPRLAASKVANESASPAVPSANVCIEEPAQTIGDGAAEAAHMNVADSEDIAAEQLATEDVEKQSESPLSTRPRRDRRPTAKALSSRNDGSAKPALASRTSQYDIPESPVKKAVPVTKQSVKLKRKVEHIIEPPDEPSHSPSKRQKPAMKKKNAPETLLDNKTRQGSPDPIALDQSVQVNEPAGSEDDNNTPEHICDDIVAPNMVFAIFSGNSRAYYPALCLGQADTDAKRFTVQWEDCDPGVVDEYGVRRLDLRIGDLVKVDLNDFPKVSHVIRGFKDKIELGNSDLNHIFTDVRGYQTLLVAPKQRKSLPANMSTEAVKKVPMSAIYLDSNMWNQMKDRVYKYKPPISSGLLTPMERSSTPSTPSSRSRRGTAAVIPPTSLAFDLTDGLFKTMAFAISYEDDVRKRALGKLVRENGGFVLEGSFLDMLKSELMQGRDVVVKEEYANFTFAALLTDRHSRREKYLQALALGLPCLSGRWAEASVEMGILAEWTAYLLPAGESAELEGATKSRVLPLPWRKPLLTITDMIAARPEILSSMRVLVVTGKGKAATKQKPYLSLVGVLLPNQIDLSLDLKGAKTMIESAADSDEPIDIVFVDDRDMESAKEVLFPNNPLEPKEEPRRRKEGNSRKGRTSQHAEAKTKNEEMDDHRSPTVKIMCNEDIVQSLILGRLWRSA